MSTLGPVLRQRSSGPLQKTLKVVVVATLPPSPYRSKEGEEKMVLTTAVSDGETVVRCTVFDKEKLPRFKV